MSLLLSHSPVVWPLILTAFLGGYLSGSVSYGLIIGKIMGHGDIRKSGSGNIGATNMLRVGGKKLATATLLLDVLKGAIPVLIAKQFDMDYAVICALGCFLGHLFPIWLKFKGGKGVATSIGISFAFSLYLGLAICATWLLVAVISRYSSLSALAAFGLAPLWAGLITQNYQITVVTLLISIMIWIKHRANIQRLAQGTESKISFKKTTA